MAYCKQNPGSFRSSGSAFVVAFALIMLNTDLHDSRLKAGSRPRKPMSLEQFMSAKQNTSVVFSFCFVSVLPPAPVPKCFIPYECAGLELSFSHFLPFSRLVSRPLFSPPHFLSDAICAR